MISIEELHQLLSKTESDRVEVKVAALHGAACAPAKSINEAVILFEIVPKLGADLRYFFDTPKLVEEAGSIAPSPKARVVGCRTNLSSSPQFKSLISLSRRATNKLETVNKNSLAFDTVILDLSRIYEQHADSPNRRVTDEDLNRWAAVTGLSQDAVCDELGVYLASGFHSGDLTFEFCDEVANDIFGLITSWTTPWPALFWKVHLAFDDGEYNHGNNASENSIEVHTKPQIAKIVSDRLDNLL